MRALMTYAGTLCGVLCSALGTGGVLAGEVDSPGDVAGVSVGSARGPVVGLAGGVGVLTFARPNNDAKGLDSRAAVLVLPAGWVEMPGRTGGRGGSGGPLECGAGRGGSGRLATCACTPKEGYGCAVLAGWMV